MKKRIIALILCVIMVTGMLPVTVFAAETDNLHHFTKRNDYTSGTFDDVQNDDWFYENVKSVYELGLMQGKGGKQFDPESGVTIAETLTIAARLHLIYDTGSDAFTASNPWYRVYVDYCASNGIASVDSDTYSQPASRAEFVMILANALPAEVFGEVNQVADNAIPDVHIKDSYGAAVYKMYRAGIMIGNDDIGTFAPDSEIKRSEVAAIVTRMVDASLRESIQLGKEYIVTFNMNGHGKQVDPQAVVEGYTAEKPADPTNASYAFKGWYTQKSGGQQFDFNTPITEDITLYARWELNSDWTGDPGWDDDYIPTYTVTFDANGSDVENLPPAQWVKAGECAIEPAAPVRDGYIFTGWFTDSNCSQQYDFSISIYSDISLYAGWITANTSHLYVPDNNSAAFDSTTGITYINNIVLIFFNEGVSEYDIDRVINSVNGTIVGCIPIIDQYQVKINTHTLSELDEICEALKSDPCVSNAIYDVVIPISSDAIPDDPWTKHWYNDNNQTWDSTNPSGENWWLEAIDAIGAWDYSDDLNRISVGVVDNGFDAGHEDLKNVIKYTSPVNDKEDHGSHVAGIIAAEDNNKKGITGIVWDCDLYTWDWSLNTTQNIANSIFGLDWNTTNQILGGSVLLIEKGAKVINLSAGMTASMTGTTLTDKDVDIQGESASTYLHSLLTRGYDFLIVQSAGNGNSNQISVDAKYNGLYCSINTSNCVTSDKVSAEDIIGRIVVVGAAQNNGNNNYSQTSWSNAGTRVDICAPGNDIYSTVPGGFAGGYQNMSGTSMAAPVVAGVAALAWSANEELNGREVKEIICDPSNTRHIVSDNTSSSHPLRNTYRMIDAKLSVEAALYYSKQKTISLNFIDTATNSNLVCNEVGLEVISSDIHATKTLSLIHKVFSDGSSNNYSTASITLPYGAYVMNFSANGYQDIVDIWTSPNDANYIVDENTTAFTIYMTPEGSVTPPNPDTPDDEDGFNITGTFVYLNEANEEIPVSSAKCMLTDVTNSNIIYFAEVVDGKLSNESFSTKPSAGTYRFELEGGDIDDDGFYSHKVIENVVINGDLDLGKIYCDRVAFVSCAVANEDNEYLNNVGMTITQNGKTVMKIDRFYHGFDVALKEGLYTLTLTCEGYSSYTRDFAVKGTTALGTIILSLDNGFAGGDGSETNPYKVSTPEQLNAVRNDLAAHYIQTNDIDMSEYGNFTPIGIGMPSYSTTLLNPVEFDPRPFTGTYDGGGYKIIGLTINENTLDCVGLFSGCDENSIVKNVNLVNASLSINKIGTDYTEQWETGNIFSISAGLISGYSSGSIINCHVSGSINVINCNDAAVGGIVGWGNVNSCTNKANIYVLSNKDSRYVDDGDVKCGGIIGGSNAINGATNNCINYGNVTVISGNSAKVGGISGSDGALTYCVNYGNIKAIVNYPNGYSSTYETASVGGIFGSSSSNNTTYCINLGLVEASIYDDRDRYTNQAYVGGIGGHSGFYESGIVTNCYNGGTNIIAVKYIDDSEGSYTEVAGNANRVIGALGGSLDENKNNYSLSTTLTNGKIASDQIGDTKINGETITQEAFDEKLEEVLSVITN